MENDFFSEIGKELIQTINSGVAVYEVQNDGLKGSDYKILDFNRTALELEGKAREEVVGKSLFDLRPNIDEYGLIPIFRKVWKTGKPAFYPAKIYVDEKYTNWYENRVFRLSKNRIVAIYDDVTSQKTAEEKLRKSESLLREVLDNLDKAIAVYEPVDDGNDFIFIAMNDFGETITHYKVEEVLGKRISQLFPGESSMGLIESLRETWRTGRTTKIPLKQYQDDRITQWVENTLFKLPSGNVVAMFEDTFEQRKIEEAIRESESRYRLAEKIGRVGHWEYNIETEKFWGSAEARRIYGFEPTEGFLSTEEVEGCIPERERIHQALVDLVEKDKPYDLEFTINPRNTSHSRIITSTAHLEKDNSGRPVKVTGIIQDVTERRQAAQMIQAREEQYYSLFNNIRDAILVTDLYWIITDCNQAFLDSFGCQREEIIGQNIKCIYAIEKEYNMIGGTLREKADNLSEIQDTASFRKNNGDVFPGEISFGDLISEEGHLKGIIAVIRDISERKKLEEQFRQSQKMEAIGKLAGGIAHDFNNLLTIINGYTEMLLEGKNSGHENEDELSQIQDAGLRAAELTEQLLAFSRKQVLDPEVVNANTLIQRMEKMLGRIIGEDIELLTEFDPHIMPVRVDPSQLEQLIMNLVINSRDAMPKGGKLTINTRNLNPAETGTSSPSGEDGTQVVISVSDSGIGMSSEVIEKVFEPFFTTKDSGKGTGMGLSTVYGIVKQSGGDIQAKSKPGEGSTFEIYLPAVEGVLPLTESAQRKEDISGTETILVVEDEEAVRKLIRRTLEKHGYKITTTANGQEALDFIGSSSGSIDLLLTDVIMPGMSGRETADAVLELRPDVKVCFMSGYTDDTILKHGIQEEEVDFIQKPFRPAELLRQIRSILDNPR